MKNQKLLSKEDINNKNNTKEKLEVNNVSVKSKSKRKKGDSFGR